MFERYTEKARRVIFFARYEALQYGSHTIAPEHVLLGLMREDKTMAARFFPFRSGASVDTIRREVEMRNRSSCSFPPKPNGFWLTPTRKLSA